MLLNLSYQHLDSFFSGEVVLVNQTIDNQAEFHFGRNQKKLSEKPGVQIKKRKKGNKAKKSNDKFNNIDNLITILENPYYLNEQHW